jgi:DNA-binding transcriptional regulator YiaG
MLTPLRRHLKPPRLKSAHHCDTNALKEEGVTQPMDWNADTIRQLRARAQLTQLQLARWLGVTIKQVKHLENRRRNPSGAVARLLDILSTELDRAANSSPAPVQVLGASAIASIAPRRRRPRTAKPPPVPPVGADDALIWDT